LPSGIVYCEMCGKPIERRRAKIVYLEGARLTLCPECYTKVSKRVLATELREVVPARARRVVEPKQQPKRRILDEYEVVPDFAERVRKAREKLGWTQRMLAEAVREGENVIKRIEAGRLVPSIDLAQRLEKVLGIKLLEPVVEEISTYTTSTKPISSVKELTLGDIVTIRRREGKKH